MEGLTPEARYDDLKQKMRENSVGPQRLFEMCESLRDMIESDRMELGLLLAALTTLDNRVSVLEAKARQS